MGAFEMRVRELASRADIKISDVSPRRARLLFRCDRSSQTLWVYPYDSTWEFSCVSAISYPQAASFPPALLAIVLMKNAKNRRGFWCIDELENQYVLEYMHNFPEYLLTPDEFSRTCWSVVEEVDALERAVFG